MPIAFTHEELDAIDLAAIRTHMSGEYVKKLTELVYSLAPGTHTSLRERTLAIIERFDLTLQSIQAMERRDITKKFEDSWNKPV